MPLISQLSLLAMLGRMSHPSPIQLKAIPIARFGTDLIAQAKSGTGKTAVFSVVILENLTPVQAPQAVIVAPAREVADQVAHVVRSIGRYVDGLTCHTFIGGVPLYVDRQHLAKGCQVCVGTPGRLADLISSGALDVSSVRMLVLDEADQLLDAAFSDEVRWIISAMPSRRQTMAISATFTEDMLQQLAAVMHEPQHISVCATLRKSPPSSGGESTNGARLGQGREAEATRRDVSATAKPMSTAEEAAVTASERVTLEGVAQHVKVIGPGDISRAAEANERGAATAADGVVSGGSVHTFSAAVRAKFCSLVDILRTMRFQQAMVFCNSTTRVATVGSALKEDGWPATSLSAERSQPQRLAAISALRDSSIRILVATDVAARGIDVERVNLVVNFDLPQSPATYLHRIGRCGRFGSLGIAVTLATGSEARALRLMTKLFGNAGMLKSLGDPHEDVDEVADTEDAEAGSTGVQEDVSGIGSPRSDDGITKAPMPVDGSSDETLDHDGAVSGHNPSVQGIPKLSGSLAAGGHGSVTHSTGHASGTRDSGTFELDEATAEGDNVVERNVMDHITVVVPPLHARRLPPPYLGADESSCDAQSGTVRSRVEVEAFGAPSFGSGAAVTTPPPAGTDPSRQYASLPWESNAISTAADEPGSEVERVATGFRHAQRFASTYASAGFHWNEPSVSGSGLLPTAIPSAPAHPWNVGATMSYGSPAEVFQHDVAHGGSQYSTPYAGYSDHPATSVASLSEPYTATADERLNHWGRNTAGADGYGSQVRG